MFNERKIPRYQSVELFVPATTAGAGIHVEFEDQPLLRTQKGKNVYIQGIETFSNQAYTQLPNGHTLATATELAAGSLFLSVENFFQYFRIPLIRLNNIYGDPAAFIPYTPNIFWFDNLSGVIWTESYVEFGPDPAGLGLPFSFLFGVYYDLTPHTN